MEADGSEVGRSGKWAEEEGTTGGTNLQAGSQVTKNGAFSKARVADALGSMYSPGSATDWRIDSGTLVKLFLFNWIILILHLTFTDTG